METNPSPESTPILENKTFKYVVKNSLGTEITGTMQDTSRDQVRARLKLEGFEPISIDEEEKKTEEVKKPFWTKTNVGIATALATVGIGGGGIYMTRKSESGHEPMAPIKVEAPKTTNAVPEKISTTNQPLTAEQIRAEIDRRFTEFNKTNAAPAVAPKSAEKTVEERLQEIKIKLEKRETRKPGEIIPKGDELTVDDQSFWYKNGPRERPAYGGNVAYGQTPIPKAPQISEKMSQQVEISFEKSLDKMFPNDTLENSLWNKIKDKNAFDFMKLDKVGAEYQALADYMKKIKEVSGLEPRSGKLNPKEAQTVEKYIEFCLEKIAKDGKLKEVEAK